MTMARSRPALAISLATFVLMFALEAATAAEIAGRPCGRLRITRSRQFLGDLDRWPPGRQIAYDYLLRTQPEPFRDPDELKQLSETFDETMSRLRGWVGHLGPNPRLAYWPMVVALDLTDDLRAKLEEVAPAAVRKDWRERWIFSLPATGFGEFEEAASEACVRDLLIDAAEARVLVTFRPDANLLQAIRRLRLVPQVRAAGLARTIPVAACSRDLGVNVAGGATYVAYSRRVEAPPSCDVQFFVVEENEIRRIEPVAADAIPGFKFPALPADVWLPDPVGPTATTGSSNAGR